MRAEVAALDPELVVHNVEPMSEIVGQGVSRERFALVLMGAFATVALTLTTLGLYAVRSRRRTPGFTITALLILRWSRRDAQRLSLRIRRVF